MQQALLTDLLGYIAAGFVFATFCAHRMALLRSLAIASNVAFIGYGFLEGLIPILILHVAMLPINIQRYRETTRGHCGTADAEPPPSRSPLLRNLTTAAFGRLRSWGNEEFRRQLCSMSAHNCRDFQVPPRLVANELRRRPSARRRQRASLTKILSQRQLGRVMLTKTLNNYL